MADEEVELQAVGLDLSWAVARLGSATPRARVIHMHPPTPTHICSHITPGPESFSPFTTSSQSRPFPWAFEVPLPPFLWTNFRMSIFSRESRALGGEIWNGDLLHVSLGDSQGVNYEAALFMRGLSGV